MDIALVHIGSIIPQYMFTCVNQLRKFTKDRIFILIDSNDKHEFSIKDNIFVFNINNLPMVEHWQQFRKIKFFDQFGLFWSRACERFFVIESVMKFLNLNKVLHIENDNLIYGNPETIIGDNIFLTRITETLVSAGIMIIGSEHNLIEFNKELLNLMKQGHDTLLKKYGIEMLNEMRLMDIMRREQLFIKTLPLFPDPEFKYVYDCASWGQYAAGTHQEPGKSYISKDHIIGKEISNHNFTFNNGKPMVDNVPLFNLHIHSKQLEKWKT